MMNCHHSLAEAATSSGRQRPSKTHDAGSNPAGDSTYASGTTRRARKCEVDRGYYRGTGLCVVAGEEALRATCDGNLVRHTAEGKSPIDEVPALTAEGTRPVEPVSHFYRGQVTVSESQK